MPMLRVNLYCCTSLVLLNATILCGPAQASVAMGPSRALSVSRPNPPSTRVNRLLKFAASRRAADAQQPQEPQGPMTETEASAQCWMKYERGRRDLPLDQRADLVNKCIDAKMHGRAAR